MLIFCFDDTCRLGPSKLVNSKVPEELQRQDLYLNHRERTNYLQWMHRKINRLMRYSMPSCHPGIWSCYLLVHVLSQWQVKGRGGDQGSGPTSHILGEKKKITGGRKGGRARKKFPTFQLQVWTCHWLCLYVVGQNEILVDMILT